jgi:hypothetical protein|nr:hypothetical protein Q903MT_gene501 [Picea sitchensis]
MKALYSFRKRNGNERIGFPIRKVENIKLGMKVLNVNGKRPARHGTPLKVRFGPLLSCPSR